MKSIILSLSLIAVALAGCGDDSNDSEPSLAGLWRFAWETDGKDDADIQTVELTQDGKAVSGRGCATHYEDRAGTFLLANVTCGNDKYVGTLQGSQLELQLLPADTTQKPYALHLSVDEAHTMLVGTGQGARCTACAISATRIKIGDTRL